MSAASTGAWRIPNFIVHTALSPLLANEQLHSALTGSDLHNPPVHGPSFHTDRSIVQFVPATLFISSTASLPGTRGPGPYLLPAYTLTDGVDVTLYTSVPVPEGAVTVTALKGVLLLAALAGAGDIVSSIVAKSHKDGETVLDAIPLGAVANTIPANAVNADVIYETDMGAQAFDTSALPYAIPAGTEFFGVNVRRVGNSGLDTYNADAYLLGVNVTWSVDQ